MKNRLFIIIILLSVTTAFAASAISTFIYYEFYLNNAKEQIKTITELSSKNSAYWDDYSSIHKSVNNILRSVDYKIRITLIENNGNVIYDNLTSEENLNNHRDRPEIVDAFNKGYGESTRYSDTLNKDTYYFAVKLNSNDNVLRLSRELDSVKDVFMEIVPMMIILFILLILLDLLAARFITKKILKPVNHMLTSLDDMMEKDDGKDLDIYEEFAPLKRKINEQTIISNYINDLKYERDTIGIITENMKEGLILLNKHKQILSINSSGKHMIGNESFNLNDHKNILELTRNADIIKNIDNAISENKHIVYDIEINRYHYRYYLSPVTEKREAKVEGLLILIEDVTIQKNAEIIRHEFSANVSHELKTPLTTMIGFAEMIKEGLITDMESIKKYSGLINKEGLRLIALIEDIMRLSKIEEGIDLDNNSLVNLKEISTEVCRLLEIKADSRNVELVLHADNIYMTANKNYINEMLYNLIDNGIKYNYEGGKIEINIHNKDSKINIIVKDTGVGIAKGHQDRVFERFYRVDKSRSKETGGTGLGLSIVKHIVELYDGIIKLESKVNEGTSISIIFPNV